MTILKHIDLEVPAWGEFAAGPQAWSPPTSAYEAAVLADSPAAYWRLGESIGASLAVDEMGANDLTYDSDVTLERTGLLVGDPDTAVKFGTTANAQAYKSSPTSVLTPKLDQSFEWWMSYGTLPTTIGVLSYTPDANTSIDIRIDGSGERVRVVWKVGGTFYAIRSATSSVKGGTYHVVAGLSAAGALSLYIDGSSDGSTFSGSATDDTTFRVGRNGTSNPFRETMDEVAVYNSLLSPTRITAHYNAGIGV